MKPYLFIFIGLLFFSACGLDDCGTYCLSNGDKAFIPYQINDTIRVNYVDYSDSTLNTSYFLNTRYRTLDTANNNLLLDVCENAFEKETIVLENHYIKVGYYRITLTLDCKEAGFNTSWDFESSGSETGLKDRYYIYSRYNNETSNVYNFSSKKIDGKDFENVFVFAQSDSLYYSPHYGLIKLNTTRGYYTFTNL